MGVTWRDDVSALFDRAMRSEEKVTPTSILIRAQRPIEVPHRSVSHVVKIICLLILAAMFSSTTTWAVALKGTFTSELYARTTVDADLNILDKWVHINGENTIRFSSGQGLFVVGRCTNVGCHGAEDW